MRKYKVKTKEITLTSISIPNYPLPTFQKARLKTVYYKVFGIKIIIARYIFFTYIATIPGAFSLHLAATLFPYDQYEYIKTFIKLK